MPALTSASILIAAHNRCDLLAQTLASLAALTRPPALEIDCLVIANACTDDTEAVVRRAAPSMPFPTRVIAEPRRGVSFARNRAVDESRGDLCAFIDGDCLADPNWLVEHARAYHQHAADLVTGKIDLWWAEGADPGWLSGSMREALGEHHYSERAQQLHEPRAYAANFSFRRAVFARAGPFRTDIGRSGTGRLAHEEQVFARRAMAAGNSFWWSPHAVVRHHVPAASLTDAFFARSAYWGSVSHMMTVEPFAATDAARVLLKSPLRAAICQARIAAACAQSDSAAAARARMDRAGALGRIRGLWTRVTRLNRPRP